jgi:hypothetical protein
VIGKMPPAQGLTFAEIGRRLGHNRHLQKDHSGCSGRASKVNPFSVSHRDKARH